MRGFRIRDLGLRVQGSTFGSQASELSAHGAGSYNEIKLGFEGRGLGFRLRIKKTVSSF